MSILLKGLKMPEEDKALVIVINSNGTIDKPNWQWDYTLIKGAKAIPLPSHGDLIDRDSYKVDLGINDFDCEKCGWHGLFGCKREGDFSDACFFLENAEVIIPAERSEDA